MATQRYNKWLQLTGDGTIDVSTASMNVLLVADFYQFDENHSPENIDEYVLNGVNALVNDFFSSNSINNIIERTKEYLMLGITTYPDVVTAEIDRVFVDYPDKAESLKQLITNPTETFWKDLKEAGIGYFVFENVENDTLCFVEDIE